MRLTVDPGLRPATAKPQPRSAPAPPATEPLSGARTLLAQDGPDDQRLLQYMLSRTGAIVTVVTNGMLPMEAIHDAHKPRFDLILLDKQMPELDGYSTTRTPRSLGVRIPIIILTVNALDGHRGRCLAAGCDDYAHKHSINKYLRRNCARWLHAVRSENRAVA